MSQQNINVKGAAEGQRNHFENHTGNLWYSPEKDAAWYAHWNGAAWDLEIGGFSLESMKQKYHDLVLITSEALEQIRYEFNRKPVNEITEEIYTDMLEVLPPMNWHRSGNGGGTSFHMEEIFMGGVVDIYVEWEGRFFELRDDLDLSHEQIIAVVKQSVSK